MTRIIQNQKPAARLLLRLMLAVLVAGVLFVPARATHAASTAEQRCAAEKNKTAGKYAACRQKAEAKRAAGGDLSAYSDALGKCETTFSKIWQKIDDKALALAIVCPADKATIKAQADAYTDQVAGLVGGSRFADNLDGTVTDLLTGFQWEKKDSAYGGENYANPHDADNVYTWNNGTAPGVALNGTIVQFFAALNTPPCFAGHCDWTLPHMDTLQSILLAPDPCSTNPCIDPIFGPTVDGYWTSTTFDAWEITAWAVFFRNGSVFWDFKNEPHSVRAVRYRGS